MLSFHVKFVQTDGQMDNGKTICPQSFDIGGIKNAYILFKTKVNFSTLRKKPISPFPKQAFVFTCLQYKSFENNEGKGETAPYKQFLLFPHCFQPFWRALCNFHQI